MKTVENGVFVRMRRAGARAALCAVRPQGV